MLGSVRDWVDYTGALGDHIDYDSYGLVTTETHSNIGDRYSWTGRELHACWMSTAGKTVSVDMTGGLST